MKLQTLLLAAVLTTLGQATPALYSIGPDADPLFPVPRSLATFDATAGSAVSLALLGDGSLGFSGLVYRSDNGSFYAVGNDSSLSGSTLYNFTTAGTLSPVHNLGDAFTGGLAWDGAVFYAIAGNPGAQSLYQFDPVGLSVTKIGDLTTGIGFAGLAWNSVDSKLYGIGSDSFGNSIFYRISVADGSAAALGITLGSGFNGGLAFDPVSGTFYALASDFSGDSFLYHFLISDASATLDRQIGSGFINAGLTLAPQADVPEPSTFLLAAGGLALACIRRRHAQ